MFKKIKKFRNYVKESNKKTLIYLFMFLLILEIISGGFLIYYLSLLSGIEDVIRYIVIILIVLIMIIFISKYMSVLMRQKKKIRYRIIFVIMILLATGIQGYASYAIHNIYKPIDNINKSTVTYTTDLVVMNDSSIEKVDDIKKMKIGYISSETAKEDNKIAQKMIDENKLDTNKNETVKYDQYFDMLSDLYEKKVDAILISSNYPTMFSSIEKFENVSTDTKIITSKSMEFKKEKDVSLSNKNIIKDPFTVLLMGVDSEKDGLDRDAAFNGDSLVLITFNPNTLNATVLSIPRDTYVPIACFKNKKKNKITHAAWQGVDCMEKTIENFTGIDIDYHVKMNFKGVVGLVDALGGVDVDVPVSFCEQDSNRWGGDSQICLKPGMQTLNGEQALALARHRKTLARGDIQRGLNQQLVIQGMLQKLSDINSIEKVNSILDSVSKNMDTNITTNQILSFYNVGKDILLKSTSTSTSDIISMEQLFISGYDKMIYDPDFDLTLYNYVPYQTSIEAVSNKMKENLGLKEAEMVKTFDFSINEVYEKQIIGENMSDNKSKVDEVTNSLPNFIGKTKSYAESVLKSYNINYRFEKVEKGDPDYKDSYSDGEIIYQSHKAGTDPSKVTTLVLKYIVKEEEKDEEACPKDTTNTKCFLPNLVGKTKSEIEAWAKTLPVSIRIVFEDLDEDDSKYETTLPGKVGKMSHTTGTNLSNISTLTLYIKDSNSNTTDKEKEYTITYKVDGNNLFPQTFKYKGGEYVDLLDYTCSNGEKITWTYNGGEVTTPYLLTTNVEFKGVCKEKEKGPDDKPTTPGSGNDSSE